MQKFGSRIRQTSQMRNRKPSPPISVLSEFCIQYSAVHGILWVFATPTLGGRWAGNMSPRHQHKFTACSRSCLCKKLGECSGRQHVLHVAALNHHSRPTKNQIVQWIHFLDWNMVSPGNDSLYEKCVFQKARNSSVVVLFQCVDVSLKPWF